MPQKKPKLGQNFLTSPSARQHIVEALGDISASTVLEIGPGRGALTDLLATRARRLVAVELDRTLAPRLAATWAHAQHVRILQADILELDLATVLENPEERWVVVGNLPYYITSDILLHLFAQAAVISRAVVMVQDEVADRLAAPCGIRDYGVLSATAQMHARVEKLFTLPPEAFTPPPGVNSAVVRLDMRPRFEELQVKRKAFLYFLQLCFRQKRKTLANNFKAAEIGDALLLSAAFKAADVDPGIRAEAVPLESMARLYRELRTAPPS
ncbi:MAG: 16S rRNA (adenine(1518)-N(6)/adenine(1519)-N(6))-dimethyltransferase RsmA [Acidobacteriaceae bacterium]